MTFDLDISHQQYLQYYSGTVRQILVQTHDNIKIQFPAQFMQRFVSHAGVHGRFRVVIDENNRLVSLDRLDGPADTL